MYWPVINFVKVLNLVGTLGLNYVQWQLGMADLRLKQMSRTPFCTGGGIQIISLDTYLFIFTYRTKDRNIMKNLILDHWKRHSTIFLQRKITCKVRFWCLRCLMLLKLVVMPRRKSRKSRPNSKRCGRKPDKEIWRIFQNQ